MTTFISFFGARTCYIAGKYTSGSRRNTRIPLSMLYRVPVAALRPLRLLVAMCNLLDVAAPRRLEI